MTLYQLKPRFQALLRPGVARLAAAGITANQITLLALGLSLAMAGMLLVLGPGWCYLLLPPYLLLRMALNAVDGMLAREHRQQSRLGAVLNEVGDVLADTALFLPFALLPGVDPWSVVAVAFAAMFSEFSGVLMQAVGGDRRYDGPSGKSDRALILALLAVVVAVWPAQMPALSWVFWIWCPLLMWTAWNRLAAGLRG